ncbi:DUF2783 domain-containing protein [Ramlibacter sp. MAHUQ-53]|uniref:DUF2783 domain-containing protein n=1 Tax=unclassified Ramlibacter TaxID=2617605 RepID=UPI00362E613C
MLNTQPNMASYDDFYEALISAHQGLSTAESHAMNARLVLLLSNHIGDLAVLQEALRIARGQPAAAESASLAGRAAITPVAPSHAAA